MTRADFKNVGTYFKPLLIKSTASSGALRADTIQVINMRKRSITRTKNPSAHTEKKTIWIKHGHGVLL